MGLFFPRPMRYWGGKKDLSQILGTDIPVSFHLLQTERFFLLAP